MTHESGMGSVLGLILIAAALAMGTALLALTDVDRRIAEDFADGARAQALAEAGAMEAVHKFRCDLEFASRAKSAMIVGKPVLASDSKRFASGFYKVYAAEKDGAHVVLSIGTAGKCRRQVAVRLKDEPDGRALARWSMR